MAERVKKGRGEEGGVCWYSSPSIRHTNNGISLAGC